MDEVEQQDQQPPARDRATNGAEPARPAHDRQPAASTPQASANASSRAALLSQDRLAAFSDGVFAVAITVLVFGIPTPTPKVGGLGQALLDQWSSYAAFAISFLTIGIIWVNHHGTFARVARVDRPLLFLNLFLLMTVSFIPFPTNLLSKFVSHGGSDASVAAFVYAATMTMMSAGFGAIWIYAIRRGLLHAEHVERRRLLVMILRFTGGGLIYATCMGVAFVSPILDLVLFALLAIYYIFDQQG